VLDMIPLPSERSHEGILMLNFQLTPSITIHRLIWNRGYSYAHYLEKRNEYLERLLTSKKIPFHPPDYLDLPEPTAVKTTTTPSDSTKSPSPHSTTVGDKSPTVPKRQRTSEERAEPDESPSDSQGLNQLASGIGLISVQATSDPRYLGFVAGISFARVVCAAVKSTNSVGASSYSSGNGNRGQSNGKAEDGADGVGRRNERPGKRDEMRDSFFGLSTNKKRVRPARWPSRQLANRLVDLYFGHANPQLPILHKVEFEAVVDQVYSTMRAEKLGPELGEPETAPRKKVGARELYMMNIVFAIGAGIFLEKDTGNSSSGGSSGDELRRRSKKKIRTTKARSSDGEAGLTKDNISNPESSSAFPRAVKKARINSDSEDNVKQESPYESEEDDTRDHKVGEREERQYAPEAYHAAALPHLEEFLSSESKGGLEELQAVLLLAGYALLRPVAPGLWYIVGVAVRLAVDLGLHFEDSNASTAEEAGPYVGKDMERLRGYREWTRELRRRLWWCTYSLDRLVSTCVGRPFGIQDEVISTRVSWFAGLLFNTLNTLQCSRTHIWNKS